MQAQGYYEINVIDIAKHLRYNWGKIVACSVICAAIGFANAGRKPVTYVATAQMVVGQLSSSSANGEPLDSEFDASIEKEDTIQYFSFSDTADIASYAREILKSGVVLQPAIDELGLDMAYNELAASVATSVVGNCPILQINVTRDKEDDALAICENIVDCAPSVITSVTNISNITVISEPTIARGEAASPVRNTALGAVLGLALATGVLVVCYLMSTLVRKEEDITNMLGVKALGVIPAAKEGTENV